MAKKEQTLLEMIEELQVRMDAFAVRLDEKDAARFYSALGSKKSEAKARASKVNGAKGGRPKKSV